MSQSQPVRTNAVRRAARLLRLIAPAVRRRGHRHRNRNPCGKRRGVGRLLRWHPTRRERGIALTIRVPCTTRAIARFLPPIAPDARRTAIATRDLIFQLIGIVSLATIETPLQKNAERTKRLITSHRSYWIRISPSCSRCCRGV